jgi:hypothetical protein
MPDTCGRCGRPAELPGAVADLADGRRLAVCLDCQAAAFAVLRHSAGAPGLAAVRAARSLARALTLALDCVNGRQLADLFPFLPPRGISPKADGS